MKRLQGWGCQGCGEEFFTMKEFKKHKPSCPNCQYKRVDRLGEFQAKLYKMGMFGVLHPFEEK